MFSSLYFVFDGAYKGGVVVSYVPCRNGAFTYVSDGVGDVFCGGIYGSVIVNLKTL